LGRATLAGCGAILLWAMLALLTRRAGLPPFELMALAFGVSGLGGLAWLALRGRLGLLLQSPLAWAHGVGGLFGFHALYFASLARAPAAAANLLNYTWPLLLVLLSAALLGLRLGWRHWCGVALGGLGCGVLLGAGAAFPAGAWLGYALAAASALTWALYSALARRLAAVPSEAVIGFCAVTALLAAAVHAAVEPSVTPTAPEWAAVLLMGAGPVGAAFLLWDIGMKQGDPRRLGTLAFATPILSTALLVAAAEAPATPALFIAAALVTAGGWISAG